jgi:hypothetical protein
VLLVAQLEHGRGFFEFDGADGGHGEADEGEDFCGRGADGSVECDSLGDISPGSRINVELANSPAPRRQRGTDTARYSARFGACTSIVPGWLCWPCRASGRRPELLSRGRHQNSQQ